MESTWSDALALVNALLAGFMAIVNLALVKRHAGPRWIRYCMSAIGFYWSALYFFVFITATGVYDPTQFGRVMVRPAFTLTLAVMAASALYRWRTIKL